MSSSITCVQFYISITLFISVKERIRREREGKKKREFLPPLIRSTDVYNREG